MQIQLMDKEVGHSPSIKVTFKAVEYQPLTVFEESETSSEELKQHTGVIIVIIIAVIIINLLLLRLSLDCHVNHFVTANSQSSRRGSFQVRMAVLVIILCDYLSSS